MTVVTRDLAVKVLSVVDQGLVAGMGKPIPGQMCVEAAVCFALGEPHGDAPSCVGSAVRAYKIRLNDARWSSDAARTVGMRELAIAQLGSDTLDQRKFATRVAIATVREILARLLRMRGLEDLAVRCGQVTTRRDAEKVAREADKALRADAAAAADAAFFAAYAADAVAYAAYAAAAYAAAAAAAAYADAAYAAAAAAEAVAYAADAAAAARDSVLRFAARMVTQVLVDMGSPGAQWLDLLVPPEVLRASQPTETT